MIEELINERILIMGYEPSKAVLLAVEALRSEGIEVLIVETPPFDLDDYNELLDGIIEISNENAIEHRLSESPHPTEEQRNHSRGKGKKHKDWQGRF